MKIIAAVDENWAIGYQNKLLVHIPDDMKRFKALTSGNVVVMGRKTLQSFPGGLPLKNRVNIVLTSNLHFCVEDAVVVHSMAQAEEKIRQYKEDIYIIGGAAIYEQFLDKATEIFLTCIHRSYQADAWFPDLSVRPEWKLEEESETYEYRGVSYCYQRYVRV